MPPTRRSSRILSSKSDIAQPDTYEKEDNKKVKKCEPATSKTSDEKLCIGCYREEPPKEISKRKTIDWLTCDICGNWWHSACARLPSKDAKRIVEENIKFSCAFCVLQLKPIQARAKELLQDLSTKSTEKACPEELVSNQIIDNINTLVELTRSIVDQPSYSQTDTHVVASKENNRDRTVSPENIIIIDGIQAELQKELRESKKIRKELNKINLVTGKFEEAYSLPHGGIAIHLKEEKDRDQIIKNWSETNLGGNTVAHKPKYQQGGSKTSYIHNMPTAIPEDYIQSVINKDFREAKVHRLKFRDTNKPMPVVKVIFCSTESLKEAINSEGVFISGLEKRYKFEPEREVKFIRCFNCNRPGHIARVCIYKHTCGNCSSEECTETNCTSLPKCVNCDGQHPASSSKCSKFVSISKKRRVWNILNKRYNKHEALLH